MAKTRMRDLVVLLPGITGSVLQKDGQDVWAISGQAAWQALTSLGGSLQALKLANDDPELDDLGDGIRATRLIPDAHLVPGLIKMDGYSRLSRLMTDYFDVIPGHLNGDKPANFFEFPYDWRRDNRVAAHQLQRLIDRQLPPWRDYTGYRDAKVILLAHSMGGLVAAPLSGSSGGMAGLPGLDHLRHALSGLGRHAQLPGERLQEAVSRPHRGDAALHFPLSARRLG